jgi:hypothetical protein
MVICLFAVLPSGRDLEVTSQPFEGLLQGPLQEIYGHDTRDEQGERDDRRVRNEISPGALNRSYANYDRKEKCS